LLTSPPSPEFITEQGRRRPPPKSTARTMIRSQARKYTILEKHRRNAPPKAHSYRHRKIFQKVPETALLNALEQGAGTETRSTEFGTCSTDPASLFLPFDIVQRPVGNQYLAFNSEDPDAIEPPGRGDSRQNPRRTTLPSFPKFLDGVGDMQDVQEPLLTSQSCYRTRTGLSSGQIRQFGKLLQQQRMSLQTILGAGRINPFDTYPIKAQPYVHRLVDHCRIFLFLHLLPVKFWRHHN